MSGDAGEFVDTRLLKALVALAIVICEVVGRTNDKKGKYLAWVLAFIAVVPVVWSLVLLFNNQEILISYS